MTENIDISPSARKLLKELITRHLPGVEVWAFGSRVKWKARSNSDLDLVSFCPSEQIPKVSLLKEALEESSLPFPVDLLVWDNIPDDFRKNILENYVVFVEAKCTDNLVSQGDRWKRLKLGDVCSTIGSGATPRGGKESYKGGSTALIRSQNIHNDGFDFDGLLNITGDSVARCCQVDSSTLPSRVNQHVVIIRPDPNALDARFLRYVMVSPWMQSHLLALASSGATRNALTKSMIENLEVSAPRLEVQKAIAHILGTLDDKAALNRQINQSLEAIAQTLFKSWFVDFDSIHAKMEGRQSEGIDAETAALFPDELVDSELGLVPNGWIVGMLTEFVEINPPRQLKKGVEAPYLDMANVPTHSSRASNIIKREFSSGSKFRNGDTLLARITPCLENGKTSYVDFLEPDEAGWGSTEFIVLRAKHPLPAEYSYFLCRDSGFRAFAISHMEGTSGRQRVPNNCFSSYIVAKPPDKVLSIFGEKVKSIMANIKALDEEIRTLTSLRDTLLPKLLSGEITVSESA